MRVISYRKQLWILALLALSCISALAHAPANVVQAQSAVHRVTSPSPPQHRIVNFVAVGQPSTPMPKDANRRPAKSEAQVQEAGVLTDPGSLLPIAGLVGFSFLIGGIVCRSIKTRP